MTDLIYNHISARILDHEGHYLINPYGMLYVGSIVRHARHSGLGSHEPSLQSRPFGLRSLAPMAALPTFHFLF